MMLLPLEDTYKQITKVTVKADIFQPPMAKIPSLAERLATVQRQAFSEYALCAAEMLHSGTKPHGQFLPLL